MGSMEAHIVFDNPGRLPESPKSFEQRHRDDAATLSSNHQHNFLDICAVPSNWRDCPACRECKQALVLYLGQPFKNYAVNVCRLSGQQKAVLTG